MSDFQLQGDIFVLEKLMTKITCINNVIIDRHLIIVQLIIFNNHNGVSDKS